ncbi:MULTISPECIES: hypothetical protein [Bacteroidaceae]|jgi:hypothetical protein|uniref:hypothetical protein n=1 Tax=Bacteroidaceae TaxID=815 RepID=UPI00204D8F3F|nr:MULTISPECIES: hypothetical protein [Bacteroidaceae]DAX10208.1 MAG TPA: hypothetical protein [Bacteriophage sp.]
MRLIKIEDTNEIKPFNCGDDDLNGFLLEDARYYQEQLIANTFIMEDEETTIAFFSLLNDKISQTTIDRTFGASCVNFFLIESIWAVIRLSR